MTREEIIARIAAALAPAKAIADQATKENRQFTDGERATITEAVAKAEPFKEQLKALDADKKMRDTLAGIEDGIGVDLLDRSSRDRQVGDLLMPGAKTLGCSVPRPAAGSARRPACRATRSGSSRCSTAASRP
jgi:hypothetical protein